jgi:rhodanese-related sulfurtransferase
VLRETSVADAPSVLAAGGVVLDVREAVEVAAGSIPGAIHIPLGELIDRVGELDTTRTIACLCRSGGRSATAADFLDRHGYDAVNLAGGMLAWDGDVAPIGS